MGLALKLDINLSAVEMENGEQVSRVFCVIEVNRPNQLLTEHGGVINQTVENHRRRASNDRLHDNARCTRHVPKGLCQLLGYMVIQGLKYGVLTSFELTYFCKRNEEGEMWVSKGFYGIQDDGGIGVNFAIAAFVFKILHDDQRRLPYPSMKSESVKIQGFYEVCQKVFFFFGGGQVDKNNTFEILEERIENNCADFIGSTIKRVANRSGQQDEIQALRDNVASILPLDNEEFSMLLPWEEDLKLVVEAVVRIPWISYIGFTWDVFVKTMHISDWSKWDFEESKKLFLQEVEVYKPPLAQVAGSLHSFLGVWRGVPRPNK